MEESSETPADDLLQLLQKMQIGPDSGQLQKIKRQLEFMLHARSCQIQTDQYCNVPYCGEVKTVLAHLENCSDGRECSYAHCATSQLILFHWLECQKVECPICGGIVLNMKKESM